MRPARPRSPSRDGTTTDLTFTVACSTTTGNVLVSVTSSGEPPDANGYVATLDGAAPGQPIATAGNGALHRRSGGESYRSRSRTWQPAAASPVDHRRT